MRYLAASDLHYTLQQLDWISEQARDFDAVVLAGDLLDAGGRVDVSAQIALFIAYLRQLGGVVPVVANSGNHDLTDRRPDGEKAATWMAEIGPTVTTDGEHRRVGPDLVSACAWWEGDHTRGELVAGLEHDAALDRDGMWIWAYHSPPDASPVAWGGARYYGDDVLNGLIERFSPDLVIAGHVHDAPFRPEGSWHARVGSTVVLNAGRQPGPVPAHLIVDTSDRTASWWSFESQDTIAL